MNSDVTDFAIGTAVSTVLAETGVATGDATQSRQAFKNAADHSTELVTRMLFLLT